MLKLWNKTGHRRRRKMQRHIRPTMGQYFLYYIFRILVKTIVQLINYYYLELLHFQSSSTKQSHNCHWSSNNDLNSFSAILKFIFLNQKPYRAIQVFIQLNDFSECSNCAFGCLAEYQSLTLFVLLVDDLKKWDY